LVKKTPWILLLVVFTIIFSKSHESMQKNIIKKQERLKIQKNHDGIWGFRTWGFMGFTWDLLHLLLVLNPSKSHQNISKSRKPVIPMFITCPSFGCLLHRKRFHDTQVSPLINGHDSGTG
jgi:hypothetical protein